MTFPEIDASIKRADHVKMEPYISIISSHIGYPGKMTAKVDKFPPKFGRFEDVSLITKGTFLDVKTSAAEQIAADKLSTY